MRLKHVFIAAFGLAAVCPTQGWSQTADVFPSFGPDKEVVSGADENFRGVGQCTTYIYNHTGISSGMGNAGPAWVTSAKARKYTMSDTPADNSVGIMDPGHVYWVGSVKKDGNNYNMTNIKQDNWPGNPNAGVYAKSTNKVKFNNGASWYKSYGFITKLANGSSVKWK